MSYSITFFEWNIVFISTKIAKLDILRKISSKTILHKAPGLKAENWSLVKMFDKNQFKHGTIEKYRKIVIKLNLNRLLVFFSIYHI